MLRHFRVNLPFWRANLLQAALFAAWHLVWPVKSLVSGNADLAGAMTEGVMLVIATFISGSFYGYLYHKTGNLWAPWTAHTINNSVLNLVHIRTPAGLDGEVMVLYLIIVFGLIPLMLLIKLLAGRLGLPELRPWGEAEADQ
jgi:membrane protease YdiL (CAAX protease family)